MPSQETTPIPFLVVCSRIQVYTLMLMGLKRVRTKACLATLLSSSLAIQLSGCSRVQDYPSQPITLVCPWSPGGGTDRVSRQIASQLEREMGVPVNVINATGGSGVTGHTRGALARPDGYTITMLTVELSMLHWRGLTNITYEDFTPIVQLNRDSAAIFVQADSPYQQLADLEQAVRSNPGKLKASGTAQGGIWHVAVAGWLNACELNGNDVNWISIGGAGPSLQELYAGGVDFVCCALPEADAMTASKKVRSLGVMADQRLAQFQSVPTFREQGRDWSIAGWRGIGVPKQTPADRVAKLTTALEKVAASDEFSKFMGTAGFDISLEAGPKFSKTLATQDELFRDILSSDTFRNVKNENLGLMAFPGIVASLLVVAITYVTYRNRQHKEISFQFRRRAGVQAIAVVAAIAFFIATVEVLGFVVTATVLLLCLFLLFRVRIPTAVVTACLTSAMIYQVFVVMLRVTLPRGLISW